jgi:Fic family protein
MKWNWQKPSWPNFTYKNKGLADFEAQFLHQSGIFYGTLKHVKKEDKATLTVESLSTEAVQTSKIEGEILNRDSVQSSIRRHFGLSGSVKKVSPAEQGIGEMMVNLYEKFRAPLSHNQLFIWHKMLTKGRQDLLDIGKYRSHREPMQVVSGPIHKPKIHFEAPPSQKMFREMTAFVKWFNDTSPGKKNSLPALTRSGIAHLYFVSIHPFEDGNGRIGRAISEKVLSQALDQPTLVALSQTIEASRKEYYKHLELNNKDTEITDWLVYFAETVLAAQNYTQRLINFLIEKTKLLEKVRERLNPRQEKVLERMFREGLKGFQGGLSAENYLRITKASRATATRDLQDLVEMGAFRKTGELKYTRYFLNVVVNF